MGATNDNSTGVLLEQIIHQNQAMLESMNDIQYEVARIKGIADDVSELKVDMRVV